MTRSPLAGKQPRTPFSKFLQREGWTTARLAKTLGYSDKAVEMWRAGLRRPGPGARQLLMMHLEIDQKKLDRLLKETDR